MTVKQLKSQTKKVMRESGLFHALLRETDRLAETGALDLSPTNNMLNPKIIIHCALKNLADQYRPLSDEGKASLKNLMNF
jgi:hypothetical protein